MCEESHVSASVSANSLKFLIPRSFFLTSILATFTQSSPGTPQFDVKQFEKKPKESVL